MPYLPTAQVFLEQSRLLIAARPTTTRITTKYTLPHPDPPVSKYKPSSQSKPNSVDSSQLPTTSSPPQESTQSQLPKASLTLKTYDPVSGTCLKYRTDKGAEVGRLVVALSSCGRIMAALPEQEEVAAAIDDAPKEDAMSKEPEGKAKFPLKETKAQTQGKGGDKGGGAGGGKKKKGKR